MPKARKQKCDKSHRVGGRRHHLEPLPAPRLCLKCLDESQIGGHVGSRIDCELIGPRWNVSCGRAID